jgi:hypothetical protein
MRQHTPTCTIHQTKFSNNHLHTVCQERDGLLGNFRIPGAGKKKRCGKTDHTGFTSAQGEREIVTASDKAERSKVN